MPYKNVEELERMAAHDTCAFMMYFLQKTPYACQIEWSKRLDDEELLWEADFEPRDHGKSELFALAYPLRRICLNPDIRILIVKATKTMAVRSISVIKAQLEGNQRIKAFYAPHWLANYGVEDISNAESAEGQSTWGADKLYVKRRQVSQDPTIEGVGVGNAITGGHYDVILLDDAEDPSRMKTDTAYAEQIDWYTGTLLQLREPWTKIIVVGTFKRAAGDLYEMVRMNKLYSTTIQPSILSPSLDEITYERIFDKEDRLIGVKNIKPKDIKVLCPEKWTVERLIMDREGALTPGMTDNTWRREKMNDLRAFKENVFKREWFTNRYHLESIEDYTLDGHVKPFFRAIISGWDTAHTDKKTNSKAAFSVGCSLGIGPRGYYLLPDFFRAQVEYPSLKKQVLRLYQRVRPNVTIVENKDTGIALLQDLRKPTEAPDGEMISMALLGYEPDSDKISRAHASTSAWESGLIWIPEDCTLEHRHDSCVNAWLPGWIERHVDFPESTFKDDVDVMSMLVNYVQRLYPLRGLKNAFKAINDDDRERTHSKIVDMQKVIGANGIPSYVQERHASRVMRIPYRAGGRSGGKGGVRAIRSLPPGRLDEY